MVLLICCCWFGVTGAGTASPSFRRPCFLCQDLLFLLEGIQLCPLTTSTAKSRAGNKDCYERTYHSNVHSKMELSIATCLLSILVAVVTFALIPAMTARSIIAIATQEGLAVASRGSCKYLWEVSWSRGETEVQIKVPQENAATQFKSVNNGSLRLSHLH